MTQSSPTQRGPRTALIAAAAGVVAFAAVGAVAYAVTSGPDVVQYPPGQRPCTAALTALDAVTLAQLDEGSGGPSDPDGTIRDALDHAHQVLTTHRAGEGAYAAGTYRRLADNTAGTIPPLIAAYESEDPDTPWTEATGYYAASSDYSSAADSLRHECTRTR